MLWHIPDSRPTDKCYYGLFWKGMPDINYDHISVRDSAKNIVKFWLDLGVDGFRSDAAMHIFPPGKEDENVKWWQEFRAYIYMEFILKLFLSKKLQSHVAI